jgi:GT2 family glycosyltransferase
VSTLRRRLYEQLPQRLQDPSRAVYAKAMVILLDDSAARAGGRRPSRRAAARRIIRAMESGPGGVPARLAAARVKASLRAVWALRHAPRSIATRVAPRSFADRLFDADWYVARYPDVIDSGLEPLAHWHAIGARDERQPNPVFDVATYRYDHPDVADHDDDPLLHYVRVGRARGATPHPLFDPVWYRARNPDAGADPYLHYLRTGRAQGRAASAAVAEGVDIASARTVLPAVPAGEAAVTIVVPAYRNAALTLRCLHAIARHTPASARPRVILADDDPGRPLAPLLAGVEGLERIENPVNLGFLRNCNAAAREASGEFLVLLNSDTVVGEGWLEALLAPARRDPRVGLVGARLVGSDGRLQEAGVVMLRDGWGIPYGRGDDPEAAAYLTLREVDAVSGACLLVRRAAWEERGGFDDDYAPAFFEEYDLAFAFAEAGWKVVYQPAALVIHAGSASYGAEMRDRQTIVNHDRFAKRHAARLATRPADPADLFVARERQRAKGTVLVIDDKVPEHDRHAGALTVFQYLRLLVDEDFRVLYLPDDGLVREPYTHELRQMGIEVVTGALDPGAWFARHGRHLDWVIAARPYVAPRYLHHVRETSSARVLYYPHDLHSLRERRRYEATGLAAALEEAERVERVERSIFERVDCVLTPSPEEVPVIEAMAPGARVRVITPYFYARSAATAPAGPPLAERRAVLFLGAFDHLPNVDAATVLVREVMPLVWERVPDARVLLVGGYVTPEVAALASRRVEVTGHAPDLAPLWARARMSVSPLRYGAGVKGKIVSSLEAGVPVVTTAVGNEGIRLAAGVEALIGETPAELAAHVLALYADPARATALAEAGRRVVHERFSVARARADLFAALGLEA